MLSFQKIEIWIGSVVHCQTKTLLLYIKGCNFDDLVQSNPAIIYTNIKNSFILQNTFTKVKIVYLQWQ